MDLTPGQTVLVGLAVDLAFLCAVVILGVTHVLPSEAVVGLLGSAIGARALSGRGGGGAGGGGLPPPSAPHGAAGLLGSQRLRLRECSAIAALLCALESFLAAEARA